MDEIDFTAAPLPGIGKIARTSGHGGYDRKRKEEEKNRRTWGVCEISSRESRGVGGMRLRSPGPAGGRKRALFGRAGTWRSKRYPHWRAYRIFFGGCSAEQTRQTIPSTASAASRAGDVKVQWDLGPGTWDLDLDYLEGASRPCLRRIAPLTQRPGKARHKIEPLANQATPIVGRGLSPPSRLTCFFCLISAQPLTATFLAYLFVSLFFFNK